MACQYVSAMEQAAMLEKCSRIGQMLGDNSGSREVVSEELNGGNLRSFSPPSSVFRAKPVNVSELGVSESQLVSF